MRRVQRLRQVAARFPYANSTGRRARILTANGPCGRAISLHFPSGGNTTDGAGQTGATVGLNCGVDYAKRIDAVNAAIGLAEGRTDRPAGQARLVAVSKARSHAEIRAASQVGQRDFGENYLQEAVQKMTALSDLDLVWHFIGAIQSNKTRDIARCFQWIHTVDRARIASRLDAAADHPLDICIQVNIDAEPQKAGVAPRDLPDLVTHIEGLPRLRLRGLMAIPRADGDHRESFRALRSLFDGLADDAGDHWDSLSMGMSEDFEAAIEEGSTLVRIGTAIFGPRPTSARRTVPA